MDHLSLIKPTQISSLTNQRPKETKFGEHVKILSNLQNIYDQLKDLDVKYVIFGIEEDTGVLANCGKQGTSRAWEAFLKVLLNIQSNSFTSASEVLILGKLHFEEYAEKLLKWDDKPNKQLKKARKFVEEIDKEVAHVVYSILKAGKIPIAIGGGHNNSYGMIKGTSLYLQQAIGCINFDAHSDFRPEEGRHSGNGFTYAFAEGFLKRYFIFGLHENYTSQNVLMNIKKLNAIDYITFEDICIRLKQDFNSQMDNALKHMDANPFGIEIDCDAIKDIPSSAMTPSGFQVEDARRFINFFAQCNEVKYLHICEAAPDKSNENYVGKTISYLVTDFIRANAG